MNRSLGVALLCVGLLAVPGTRFPVRLGADSTVGYLAIITADPAVLQPGELFDLNGRTVTFSRRPDGGYDTASSPVVFDTAIGGPVALADNGSLEQPLGFSFPFFGSAFGSAFVNANGNLTFGGPSSQAHFNAGGSAAVLGNAGSVLDRFAAELPRIAVLWQDWNPAAGGTVSVSLQSDRFIATWQQVSLASTGNSATFQLVLHQSGTIQMHYQDVAFTAGGGFLVGISPGSRSRYLVKTLDLSAPSGGSLIGVAADQALAQVMGTATRPLVHLPEVTRRFVATYGDAFDQLAIFTNFPEDLDGAFAYELTIRQTFAGVGHYRSDLSSFFGSQGHLQSVLNLGPLSQWPSDPNAKTVGTHTALDVLGHETGHYWLAFVRFDDRGACSTELLGRQFAHWSFFHHTSASDMEGNDWRVNGDGTFTSIAATERYSHLDQYLMGLRSPEEVGSFFLIQNPTGTTAKRSSPPAVGITVGGTQRELWVDDVVACEGLRAPGAGFSDVNPTTSWRQPVVLVVKPDTPASSTEINKIATLRQAFVPYFRSATDGRGTLDPTLPVNIPDLTERSISDPPSTITPGASFPVSDVTANDGSAPAAASTTRYYLSSDPVRSANDLLLTGNRAVGSLDPGVDSSGGAMVTVPTTAGLGSYHLIACADAAASVWEGNEDNNCIASSARLTVGRPDLVVTAAGIPSATAPLGSSWLLASSVENAGTAGAAASTTRFYLSTDQRKDSADILMTGSSTVGVLEAQEQVSASTKITVPKAMALGPYYVLACADDTKKVTELDELNNCSVSASTVEITAADLIVSGVTVAETSAAVGGTVTVSDTIVNDGTASAAASTTRYYLSLDATFGSSDYRLSGSRSVPLLDAGRSNSGMAVLTVPSGVPPGTYIVIACGDDTRRVIERSETNNCGVSQSQTRITP